MAKIGIGYPDGSADDEVSLSDCLDMAGANICIRGAIPPTIALAM